MDYLVRLKFHIKFQFFSGMFALLLANTDVVHCTLPYSSMLMVVSERKLLFCELMKPYRHRVACFSC